VDRRDKHGRDEKSETSCRLTWWTAKAGMKMFGIRRIVEEPL
jgi:hypothetical protein